MFDHILFYPAAALYYLACLGWVVLGGAALVACRRRRWELTLVLGAFAATWCGGWVVADQARSAPDHELHAQFGLVTAGMGRDEVQRRLGLPRAVKQDDHVPMLPGLPQDQPWFTAHDQWIYQPGHRRGWSHPLKKWPYWQVEPFYDCDWLAGWFADRFTLQYMRHVQSCGEAGPLYLVSFDREGRVVATRIWR